MADSVRPRLVGLGTLRGGGEPRDLLYGSEPIFAGPAKSPALALSGELSTEELPLRPIGTRKPPGCLDATKISYVGSLEDTLFAVLVRTK